MRGLVLKGTVAIWVTGCAADGKSRALLDALSSPSDARQATPKKAPKINRAEPIGLICHG
jgi:hypothetical protein